MSTSQLYHNQDLKGVKYLRTEYASGKTIYYGVISASYIKCSKCRSRNVVRSGGVFRTFKLLPTGNRHNQFRLFIPRVVCMKCGCIRQVRVPFVEGRKAIKVSCSICILLVLVYSFEICCRILRSFVGHR